MVPINSNVEIIFTTLKKTREDGNNMSMHFFTRNLKEFAKIYDIHMYS